MFKNLTEAIKKLGEERVLRIVNSAMRNAEYHKKRNADERALIKKAKAAGLDK